MDENQAKALGATLRLRRQALGLTMRQVEAATDIPNTTILRIESGSFKAPRPDKLARIAQALGMSVGELFAQAGYLVADDLPDYATYLATKHPELPDADRKRLAQEFVELLNQLRFSSPRQPVFEETGDDDGEEIS
jgi:transcriptional regulator with XRE-family HTH domain